MYLLCLSVFWIPLFDTSKGTENPSEFLQLVDILVFDL